MKMATEKSLRDFQFWSGAKDRAEKLSGSQLDEIEEQLEELYPEGMDETQINDLFWFDFDTVAEWLGYENEEMFDFCDEFDAEERTIEIDGEVFTLSVFHDADGTTIYNDRNGEDMEVESGVSVAGAIEQYKEILHEVLKEEEEE